VVKEINQTFDGFLSKKCIDKNKLVYVRDFSKILY